MELVEETNTNNSKRLLWIINLVLQQILAIITGYVISFLFDTDLTSLWVWHTFLTSFGVIFLMLEGILILSPENHLVYGLKRKTLYQIHGYILGIGLILISIGNIFIILEKKSHFTTFHGILGLVCWILFVVCGVVGIFTYYSNFFGRIIPPIYLRFIHILLGIIVFLCGVGALATGFYKSIDNKPTLMPVLMALTILTGLAVLIISLRTLLKLTIRFFRN